MTAPDFRNVIEIAPDKRESEMTAERRRYYAVTYESRTRRFVETLVEREGPLGNMRVVRETRTGMTYSQKEVNAALGSKNTIAFCEYR